MGNKRVFRTEYLMGADRVNFTDGNGLLLYLSCAKGMKKGRGPSFRLCLFLGSWFLVLGSWLLFRVRQVRIVVFHIKGEVNQFVHQVVQEHRQSRLDGTRFLYLVYHFRKTLWADIYL